MHKLPKLSKTRKLFLAVFLPIWLVLSLAPLVVILVAYAMDKALSPSVSMPLMLWAGLLLLIGLAAVSVFAPWLNRKEGAERDMQRYAYLFSDPQPLTETEVILEDLGDGLKYTLTKDGVAAEVPQMGEAEGQVFDEVKENRIFIAWKDAEFALATQRMGYNSFLALAVIVKPCSKYKQGGALFIPFTENAQKLYDAMHAFGVDEEMDGAWTYLRYNPRDAFRQIQSRGRILVMRNKKTGKIFVDKHGNFLDDEADSDCPVQKQ